MRCFADYHPLVQLIYFLAVSLIVALRMHPCLVAISLFGAVVLFLVRNGRRYATSHLYMLAFFVIAAVVNLFFRHGGATVLFLINHNPVTLESLCFGVCAAGMLLAVLYWCRSFSAIMTTDKLLYLFGKLSPRLALIVSMALRYVPLFSRRAREVRRMQLVLGAYREQNLIDNTRASLQTVSVMTTWALENGIVTADSMAARGYGVGRRTHYHSVRLRRGDVLLLLATLLLTAVVTAGAFGGVLDYAWYPLLPRLRCDAAAILCYAAYGILVLLPTLIEIGENIRWNSLRSGI